MSWKKINKEVYTDNPPCIRQKVVYRNPDHPRVQIVSVKHAETHADGTGAW